MIYDRISNMALYSTPSLLSGINWISQHRDIDWAPGVYELESGLRLIIQEYVSKPHSECRWETHRKYIDLQYLQSGCERIYAAHSDELHNPEPYDETSDKIRYSTAKGIPLVLNTDYFVIFFPHDGHQCCLSVKEPVPVRKLCLKIPVNFPE